MWPIVKDRVAWSVRLSVGWSITVVSPAKMDEPIEMPFGLWAWVGPRNHVLDRSLDPPCRGVMLRRKRGGALWSIGTLCCELCKNGWTDRDACQRLVVGGSVQISATPIKSFSWHHADSCAPLSLQAPDNAYWDVDSGGLKKACIRWRCRLVPLGEYN